MKTRFLIFFLTFLLSAVSYAESEKYTIDSQHSYVVWRIDHLGFSNQTGKWPVHGILLLDQTHPNKSKIDITIHMKDLVTGLPELNKHLEDELFFNTKKFPTTTFVSNKIIETSKDAATVKGTLTLRGISKPVTLHVKLNKIGKNPVNEKMSTGFSATASLNRSDFGINGFLPMLGDSVQLQIDVEAQHTT